MNAIHRARGAQPGHSGKFFKQLAVGLLLIACCFATQTLRAQCAFVGVGSAGFSAGTAAYTSLAIDGSGIPYVAYEDAGTSPANKASVMKYNGTSWVQVGTAGFTAGTAAFTSLAIDGSGTPYVAYEDAGNSNKASVMKYTGTSWVQVGSAGFSAGQATYTSLAIDGSGTPYVAYFDGGGTNKASVMKYNGTSWVQVGSGISAGQVYYTSLAIDGSGTLYIAYEDANNAYRASVMKYTGTSWVQVGSAAISGSSAAFTSLAIDGSGTPYLAYEDLSNSSKASVMKYNGTSWVQVGTAGFTAGTAAFTSLAIDGSGTPYVASQDAGNSSKASVMRYNGTSWVQVGTAGFSAGQANYTSLAINGSGIPYIAYSDGGYSSKAIVQAFLCPTIFYSAATGRLDSLGTWGSNTDGTGTHPVSFTSQFQIFTIANGNTTALSANLTISGGGSTIALNGKFALNGHILTIPGVTGGSATNCFTGSATSGLVLTAAQTGSIYFDQTTAAGNVLDTLAINGNTTLGNALNMAAGSTPGTFTVAAGTLTTGGNLNLLSDANGTARIAAVAGAISGNVNIQRYVPGQRGYRLLGHPYTTAQNLTTLGTYFDITGISGLTNSCTGTNPSTFSYTPGATPGYVGITTATGTFPTAHNTTNSHANGILAFVRGAPGQDCLTSGTTPPSAVTFVTAGAVNTGNITQIVPAGGWNLIANPYPSQVLLSGVTNIGSVTITAVNPAGQFINSHTNGTQYFTSSSAAVLPINGAVLMHNATASAVTLTFHESDKVATAPAGNLFKTTGIYPELALAIYHGSSLWDSWNMLLQPGAGNTANDNGDLEKMSNAQFDIYSLSADNEQLSTDARDADSITDGATIQLGLRSVPQDTYMLNVSAYSLPVNKTVYLHDKYTNTYALLSNGASYPFTVDADATSQGARMELVFNDNNTGVGNVTGHAKGITIAPNPATSNINVNYSNAYAGAKEISIMNMLGQVVRHVSTAGNMVTIPVSELANGVYVVRTVVNGKSMTERFVKY